MQYEDMEIGFPDEALLAFLKVSLDELLAEFDDLDDIVNPTLTIMAVDMEGKPSGVGQIELNWGGPQEKYEQIHTSGHLIVKSMDAIPIAVTLVSDAWVVVKQEDEISSKEDVDREIEKYGSPSRHPDRVECFLVQTQTWDRRAAMAMIPYDRVDGKRIIIHDDMVVDDEVHHPGEEPDEEMSLKLLDTFYDGAEEEMEKL